MQLVLVDLRVGQRRQKYCFHKLLATKILSSDERCSHVKAVANLWVENGQHRPSDGKI